MGTLSNATDVDRAYYRWRYYHPAVAEDPRAAYAAGAEFMRERLMAASVEWAQLAPILGSLLEELVDIRERRAIEDEIVASDMRPAF